MRHLLRLSFLMCSLAAEAVFADSADSGASDRCLQQAFQPSEPLRELLALQLGNDLGTEDWRPVHQSWASKACGEPLDRWTEVLEARTQESGTALWAVALLVDSGVREPLALVKALPQSDIGVGQYARALDAIGGLFDIIPNAPSPEALRPALAFALESHETMAVVAAQRLLARMGEGASGQEARATQLMACADHVPPKGCLELQDIQTGGAQQIQAHWDGASPEQRYWLAKWAAGSPANQNFLAPRLLEVDSSTQAVLMTSALQRMEGSARLHLSLQLLKQVRLDPMRQPASVDFDCAKDSDAGRPGFDAYGEERYPLALEQAFGELARSDSEEVRALLISLGELEHAWLSTMAGLALLGQDGQMSAALHASRYCIESDGLPPWVLLTEAHMRSQELLLFIVKSGNPDKVLRMAGWKLPVAARTPALIEAVTTRMRLLPERMRAGGVDLTLDQKLTERLGKHKALTEELDALGQLASQLATTYPDQINNAGAFYQEQGDDFWRALAMFTWVETRDPRAQTLIDTFRSHPQALARRWAEDAAERMLSGEPKD